MPNPSVLFVNSSCSLYYMFTLLNIEIIQKCKSVFSNKTLIREKIKVVSYIQPIIIFIYKLHFMLEVSFVHVNKYTTSMQPKAYNHVILLIVNILYFKRSVKNIPV